MTALILHRSTLTGMLWHLALYGLTAILEDADVDAVRVSWTGGIQPRAQVDSPLDEQGLAQVVRAHAQEHAEGSWVREDVTLRGSARGLMSPRLSTLTDDDFAMVQQRRHVVLDALTADRSWLDLRMIAGMGEPAYWSCNPKGEPLQDDGASRWDMQPRNQGSELVRNRIRKLAQTLAVRSEPAVVAAFCGVEADGSEAPGLPSASGSDSAISWCALWGMSQLPLAAKVNGTASTTGHMGHAPREWYYAPYWTAPWRPSRLRSILAAAQLKTAAAHRLDKPWGASDTEVLAAVAWLRARGVSGVVRFPIARFGSDKAPERRAMLGTPLKAQLP